MLTYKEEVYKNVDFKLIYTKANEILASSSVIETFPFKMKAFLAEQSDIRLCTFAKANEKYHVQMTAFGSESAVLEEFCGANILFYNQDEPDYRIRFSILHEYGHYVLGHKMNLRKEDPLYDKQELEANVFAAQILMPEQIIRELPKREKRVTKAIIKEMFAVSSKAVDKRLATLSKTSYEWKRREEKLYDDIIVARYEAFLNKYAPIIADRYCFEDEYERQKERDSWYSCGRW